MDVEEEMQVVEIHVDARPLYEHLRQRLALHRISAVKRNQRYKTAATVFNYALPLAALTLTILISVPYLADAVKLFVGGFVAAGITILSSINSVMRPVERYQAYASACMSIQEITFDLQRGLRERARADLGEVLEFLGTINERISAVGEVMASLPVPRMAL